VRGFFAIEKHLKARFVTQRIPDSVRPTVQAAAASRAIKT